MDVVSLCPLRVASMFWQPREGVHAMTVVCRATFELVPGPARLAAVQDYPSEEDNHWNDDPVRSLYCACDFVPFKPRCDVTLVGDAFAPKGQPVRSLTVRMVIGSVDKTIEVFCDRYWSQEGEFVEGERFARMPLRWERAAGGPETSNPVGINCAGEPDRFGRVAVPNLLPPGLTIGSRGDVVPPICFAPIAADWRSRRALLGRHGRTWSDSSWHERPLPADIDGSFFNSAPTDQRPTEIRANERIVLENLHPNEPRLVSHLPGLLPRAFLERSDAVHEVSLVADTLWLDTVRAICTVTWRGRVDLASPADQGRVYVALQEPGQLLRWPDVSRLAGEALGGRGETPAPRRSEAQGQRAPAQRQAMAMAAMDPEDGTRIAALPAASRALPFVESEEPKAQPRPSQPDPSRRPAATTAVAVAQPADRSPAWLGRSIPPLPREAHDNAPPPAAPPAVAPPLPPVARPMGEATGLSVVLGPAPAPVDIGGADPAPASRAGAAASPWASAAPAGPGPAAGQTAPPPPVPPSLVVPSAQRMVGAPSVPAAVPSAPSFVPPVVLPPNPVVTGEPPLNLRDLPPSAGSADAGPADGDARAYARPSATHEIVELLWFDPEKMGKIRAQPHWAELIAELHGPSAEIDPLDFDTEMPPEDPPEVRDRRDIVGIMTRARTNTAAELPRAMLEAVDGSGSFDPPVVLVGGRLVFPFDELETLKATVTLVTPLVAGNKKLQDAIDTVNQLLQTPWLQSSGEVAEGMTQRIKEEYKQGNRTLPADYLDEHTGRILLEQRHYQKRKVFGDEWIRALLSTGASREAIPTYIPAALAKELPMFQSFPARVVAEAHVQQDQYESHEGSLKVLALGRVVTFSRSGGLR